MCWNVIDCAFVLDRIFLNIQKITGLSLRRQTLKLLTVLMDTHGCPEQHSSFSVVTWAESSTSWLLVGIAPLWFQWHAGYQSPQNATAAVKANHAEVEL